MASVDVTGEQVEVDVKKYPVEQTRHVVDVLYVEHPSIDTVIHVDVVVSKYLPAAHCEQTVALE